MCCARLLRLSFGKALVLTHRMVVYPLTVERAAKLSALLGALVYINSLGLQFCFDDVAAIESNVDLRANVSWSNLLRNDFWGVAMDDKDSHKSYRPLTVATFRLNYMLHELEPLGYHLVNVLLHSAVCYLYVLLCGVVFSEVWPALIAGLLFAVHPIHTEAVSGVVGRADILSCLFFLSSIFTYKKSLSSNNTVNVHLVSTLFLVLCSTLSKEIGITAVAICPLFEIFIHKKMNVKSIFEIVTGNRDRKKSSSTKTNQWLKAVVIRACILAVFTIIFLYFRFRLNKTPPLFSVSNNPALTFPTPLRQLHWCYLCVLNVWLLLSPSQLCAEYAMGTIPPIISLTDPRNLLTLVLFTSLLSMGCYAMSCRDGHHRKLMFGLCLMIIPFIPASNLFFPVGFVIAERVLYIPSMGFCMLVAYGAWILISNLQLPILKTFILYLILIHGMKTVVRNRDWYDSYTLFSSAIQTLPTNGKMWSNLAVEAKDLGNLSHSELYFRQALTIEPNFTTGYMNLAYLLKYENRTEEAIEMYRVAADLVTTGLGNSKSGINVSPKDIKVYTALANMIRQYPESYQEAYEMTEKAVKQEADWEEAHNMMGNCLLNLGRVNEARDSFKRSVQLKPDYAIAHSNLGNAYEQLGELTDAEHHYREALNLDGNHTLSKFRLAKLITDIQPKTVDRLLEADTLIADVIAEDPQNGNATFCRGLIHYDLGNFTTTIELIQQTLNITPNHSEALYNLGVLYTGQDRLEECVEILLRLQKSHPGHLLGRSQLGTCYMKKKEFKRARDMFTSVLEEDPNHGMALQNYGVMLINLKENEQALDIFTHLSLLHPDDQSFLKQKELIQKHILKHSSTASSTAATSSSVFDTV